MNTIQQIEAALETITKGKWMAPGSTGPLGAGVVSAPAGTVVALRCGSDADAEFIAHAPEWLTALLPVVKAATRYSDYCDRHLMVDYIDEDMMADGAKIVDELQAAVRMLNK